MNIPIPTTAGNYVAVSQDSDGIRLEILGTGSRLAPHKLTLSLRAAMDLAEEIEQAILDHQDEEK